MTQTANPHRGEAEIQIDGKVHKLRPSFEALVAAEQDVGSLFRLVERASEGALTLSEITDLLWHCLQVENRPSREDVGKAVLTIGLVGATAPIRIILAQVLQGQR